MREDSGGQFHASPGKANGRTWPWPPPPPPQVYSSTTGPYLAVIPRPAGGSGLRPSLEPPALPPGRCLLRRARGSVGCITPEQTWDPGQHQEEVARRGLPQVQCRAWSTVGTPLLNGGWLEGVERKNSEERRTVASGTGHLTLGRGGLAPHPTPHQIHRPLPPWVSAFPRSRDNPGALEAPGLRLTSS